MEKIKDNSYLPILMWSAMVSFFMYQFIARSSFPTVLTEEYMKFFGLDAKGVGVLVSCYYFLYTFVQIPIGIIVDKYNVRSVATISIIACATGVLLFIATRNYYLAGFGQMLIGLGASSAFIATIKVVVSWFPENKRAMMVSFAISIGCIGPVIFGPLVAKIVKIFDWRSMMFTFSILGYILAIFIWNIVRDKSECSENKQLEQKSETGTLLNSLKKLFSSTQIWILVIFSFAQYAPLSALADLWGTSYIKKLYKADTAVCSLANNMIYLGMVFGSPFWSYMSSVLNSYKKPMVISILCASITFFLIIFLSNIPLSVMFCLFFILGFSSGAMLAFPLGTALFPKSMSATISGFLNTGSMMSGVILMPLIGFLIDHSWNGIILNEIKVYNIEDFRFGFLAVLISLCIGFIFSLMIKDRSLKNN